MSAKDRSRALQFGEPKLTVDGDDITAGIVYAGVFYESVFDGNIHLNCRCTTTAEEAASAEPKALQSDASGALVPDLIIPPGGRR